MAAPAPVAEWTTQDQVLKSVMPLSREGQMRLVSGDSAVKPFEKGGVFSAVKGRGLGQPLSTYATMPLLPDGCNRLFAASPLWLTEFQASGRTIVLSVNNRIVASRAQVRLSCKPVFGKLMVGSAMNNMSAAAGLKIEPASKTAEIAYDMASLDPDKALANAFGSASSIHYTIKKKAAEAKDADDADAAAAASDSVKVEEEEKEYASQYVDAEALQLWANVQQRSVDTCVVGDASLNSDSGILYSDDRRDPASTRFLSFNLAVDIDDGGVSDASISAYVQQVYTFLSSTHRKNMELARNALQYMLITKGASDEDKHPQAFARLVLRTHIVMALSEMPFKLEKDRQTPYVMTLMLLLVIDGVQRDHYLPSKHQTPEQLNQFSPSLAVLIDVVMGMFRKHFLLLPIDDKETLHTQVCEEFATQAPRILTRFVQLTTAAITDLTASASSSSSSSKKSKGASKKPKPDDLAALAALQRIIASASASAAGHNSIHLTVPCLCHGKTVTMGNIC
jgi:hypothetical protein